MGQRRSRKSMCRNPLLSKCPRLKKCAGRCPRQVSRRALSPVRSSLFSRSLALLNSRAPPCPFARSRNTAKGPPQRPPPEPRSRFHRAAAEGWGSTQNRAIELHVRALSYIRTAERYESCITFPARSGHAIECDPIDATRSARRTPAHVVVSKLLLDFVSDLISLTPLLVCRFSDAKIDTFLNFSLWSPSLRQTVIHDPQMR